MKNYGIFAVHIFLLISEKLNGHFEKILLMSSQHKLISKCAKFHCHYAYSSEAKGRVFLNLLLQIKYAIPDKPNNIGLTVSSKNDFSKSDESGFLV